MKFDELNELYRHVDRKVEYYTKEFIRLFNKLKARKRRKPSDFIMYMDEFYEDLYLIALECYEDIAEHYYGKKLGREWVKKNLLEVYDPITLYIFDHEVERKKGRHIESVLASDTPNVEHDKALKYWVRMFAQYADETADAAHLKRLQDEGDKKVVWRTREDSRVCRECRERNGKIYPISKVPAKPHIGCRCWLEKANG